MSTRVFLLTPPFTQLNTPYPATAYLKGFLNTKGIVADQADLGIDVINLLFSRSGLERMFSAAEAAEQAFSERAERVYSMKQHYLRTIDAVRNFLQGKNPALANLICTGNFLPEGSRFTQLSDLEWAFGAMGFQDKAKHLATLYLEDLSDFIVDSVDPFFGFTRYAERLSISAASFDELHARLQAAPGFIDLLTIEVLERYIKQFRPDLVAISAPFPGNVYSGFRCAKWLREHYPQIKTALGGGYPNTELRTLQEPRVFDYFHFITLDDGEAPLWLLCQHIEGKLPEALLKRTFLRRAGGVVYENGALIGDIAQKNTGTPDYTGLKLDQYLSVIEIPNPMHRLWSDGRWNKLTLAHGCYWGKCTFCDISLDYIGHYEASPATLIADRMETLIMQTGSNGFHFVDEAAPPALMRDLALEILRRNLTVVWWTNIRFEKSFHADLCRLLAASGCIAVSGGLEVASDRLLKLIDKGVTVTQVAKVADNFTEAGIMVHAYLMYGFPTQTAQETIDSLEIVRQLFEKNIVQSGFWHRFAMTAHSPTGMEPERFGVKRITQTAGTFANNEVAYEDPSGTKHELFSEGLRKSLFNYMHGMCFDFPLQEWFDFKIPATQIPRTHLEKELAQYRERSWKSQDRFVWTGADIVLSSEPEEGYLSLILHNLSTSVELYLPEAKAEWIADLMDKAAPSNDFLPLMGASAAEFTAQFGESLEQFLESEQGIVIRQTGLLIV
ncbi:B12-binding domain-containing radical SAM protein [Rurimicrobium arvi]|uniref:Radical SAM protein n=1 Tax=Rurimicrobium arvi TaxID=2049916 RepID=A0ABP8MTK6_9BACT